MALKVRTHINTVYTALLCTPSDYFIPSCAEIGRPLHALSAYQLPLNWIRPRRSAYAWLLSLVHATVQQQQQQL